MQQWRWSGTSHTPHVQDFLQICLQFPNLSRYIGFFENIEDIENIMKTEKTILSLIFSWSQDLSSLTGQNLAFLLLKYKKNFIKNLILDKCIIKNAGVYPLQSEENWKMNIIEEICLIKLDFLEINVDNLKLEGQETNFDSENLDEVLEHLCTKWPKLVSKGMLGPESSFIKTAPQPTHQEKQ